MPSEYVCPLHDVDRRLDDVHRQWHAAEDVYFDPEAFRVAIQTVIQNLRTVTFILQKQKSKFGNFDTWYLPWQQKFGADPLMIWMRDMRNKIEKEGDLEAHSVVRAEIIASYLDEGPRLEVPAELFQQPWRLIKSIPQTELGEHVRRHGVLRIERRWVENTLPEHELLDALAIAYGRVSELVDAAHAELGLPTPGTIDVHTKEQYDKAALQGRMRCMISHSDRRALQISLADGIPMRQATMSVKLDPKLGKEAVSRYDVSPEKIFGPPGASYEQILDHLFETARKMFLVDGSHVPIFFLFQKGRLVRHLIFHAEDVAQKFLLMRTVADEVTKIGADAIISINEIWTAPAGVVKPYQRAADYAERGEGLAASLLGKDGTAIQIVAEVVRDNDKVAFGETEVTKDASLIIFAPVLKAWQMSVPDKWISEATKLLREPGKSDH